MFELMSSRWWQNFNLG